MTYSFELFDIGLSRRAYWSPADLERAGIVAELTHVDVAAPGFAYPRSHREMCESVVQVDIS